MKPHGTNTRYAYYGCRCEACTAAHSEDCRRHAEAYRRRKHGQEPLRDAAPTWELIDCLKSFGIRESQIARALGLPGRIVRYSRRRMRASSAEAVESLHWGLWRRHGPFREHCKCEVPVEVLASLEAA